MPSSLYQELNRSVHSMQSRVADLIERVQDEIILESTLQINDELNSVFVRYERSEYTGTSSEPVSTHDSVCVCVCVCVWGGGGGTADTCATAKLCSSLCRGELL